MQKLKMQILADPNGPAFKSPTQVTKGAVCWDIYAHQITVGDFGKVTVSLGFALEIPEGYAIAFVPRSGITKSQFTLTNSPGQIDSDYRGLCMLKFTGIPKVYPSEDNQHLNIEYGEFPYKVGERVGQMYLRKVHEFELAVVGELSKTERGEGGFGSTGKL